MSFWDKLENSINAAEFVKINISDNKMYYITFAFGSMHYSDQWVFHAYIVFDREVRYKYFLKM